MRYKYLKHIELPFFDGNYYWSICPYTGYLLKNRYSDNSNNLDAPRKVFTAIEFCSRPYICEKNNNVLNINKDSKIFAELDKMHSRFLKISNKRFYMTRLYSSFRNLLFENSIEAIGHINALPMQMKMKHQLCLQRVF
mgnify:FL=1